MSVRVRTEVHTRFLRQSQLATAQVRSPISPDVFLVGTVEHKDEEPYKRTQEQQVNYLNYTLKHTCACACVCV